MVNNILSVGKKVMRNANDCNKTRRQLRKQSMLLIHLVSYMPNNMKKSIQTFAEYFTLIV